MRHAKIKHTAAFAFHYMVYYYYSSHEAHSVLFLFPGPVKRPPKVSGRFFHWRTGLLKCFLWALSSLLSSRADSPRRSPARKGTSSSAKEGLFFFWISTRLIADFTNEVDPLWPKFKISAIIWKHISLSLKSRCCAALLILSLSEKVSPLVSVDWFLHQKWASGSE